MYRLAAEAAFPDLDAMVWTDSDTVWYGDVWELWNELNRMKPKAFIGAAMEGTGWYFEASLPGPEFEYNGVRRKGLNCGSLSFYIYFFVSLCFYSLLYLLYFSFVDNNPLQEYCY